jgi:hypothetical protein
MGIRIRRWLEKDLSSTVMGRLVPAMTVEQRLVPPNLSPEPAYPDTHGPCPAFHDFIRHNN